MSSALPLYLAEYHRPLFGNQWLALAAILLGVAVFMLAIAGVGRWLAATHPETPPKSAAAPLAAPPAAPPLATVDAPAGPSNETLAIIAACVAVSFGDRARIMAIRPAVPSIEMLMQQWSLEGRRQIYSSHQIR